jgi:hypothetical protein
MNILRISLGILIGTLFSGLLMGLASYVIKTSEPPDFWNFLWLIVTIFSIYSAIIGAIIALIVGIARLNFMWGGLTGFLVSFLSGLLVIFLTGGAWERFMINSYYASVIIATISGFLVSLVNYQKQTELS